MTRNLIDEYQSLLSKFVAFKSVSTDKQFRSEVVKTVNWLAGLLRRNGFRVELWTGENFNPVLFAEATHNKKLETVLVYGHYDVQPASLADGWSGDPFTLRRVDGRLVARGIIDNKGQILIHIFTVLNLLRVKELRYNVKFLIEGDEETAGGQLGRLVRENRKKLSADHILVSDGEIAGETPTLEASLRGGFNLTLTYTTARTNLHSGIYGSAAPNAAHELSKLLAGIYDRRNRISIPGFYDDVDRITPAQLRNNRELAKLSKAALRATGIRKFLLEDGLDFISQTGLRPAIQVTGFSSGYTASGYANIVPAAASAKVNFRLVASQDPKKILALFRQFVTRNTPKYVRYRIEADGFHQPVKVDVTSEKARQVRRLLKEVHGRDSLVRHVGGAIPVILEFKRVLGKDALLVPLCNDDCNMHGVDENFRLDLIEKGLDFSEHFFKS